MIYVAPGASFTAVVSDYPTGLTGVLGVRIRDTTEADVVARHTTSIVEGVDPDFPTVITYTATLVAPAPSAVYEVMWDDSFGNIASDTLIVSTLAPGDIVTGGDAVNTGGSTPYITPAMLTNAPLGLSWKTIPSKDATAQEQLAEVTNICWRASDLVDSYCNQPLRATLDTETVYGPDYRFTLEPSGVAHVILSRWPILKVTAVKYAQSAVFPRSWTTIDPSLTDVDESLMSHSGGSVSGAAGVGPSGIYIAPGYLSWGRGRRGYILSVKYENGWPHTGLTASTGTAPGNTLAVDDCTGFDSGGVVAMIYDGASTESVSVTSTSAETGPGTLTLSGNHVYPHAAGIVVSTLPQNVLWAAMLFAASQAMARGATAITVQALPGSLTGGGEASDEKFMVAGEVLLSPYRRTI